jgi:heptosyltransferase-2
MQTTSKTLVVAPAWVGDMLMSQPLYTLLKQQHQQIDILAPKSTLLLAERMPEISKKIEAPLKHGELNLKCRRQLGKNLRDNNYDHAIVLPNSLKSALIPWWAKIPKRTGYLGEQRYLLFNDIRRLDAEQYPGLISRYAALGIAKDAALPSLSQPKLNIDSVNLQHCLEKLTLNTDKPILALCPGAEFGPAKRWPAEYYAKVALYYLRQDWQVWIFGTKNEADAAQTIQQHCKNACVDLTGKTSLLDAIDLLSGCQAAVSNDSGLMHIAAAVGLPLVAVYGSTSPTYTPPASDRATILQLDFDCIPCFKRECPLTGEQNLRCLKQLQPEQVIAALKSYHT